jgi:hypothetical protein
MNLLGHWPLRLAISKYNQLLDSRELRAVFTLVRRKTVERRGLILALENDLEPNHIRRRE